MPEPARFLNIKNSFLIGTFMNKQTLLVTTKISKISKGRERDGKEEWGGGGED